MNTLLLLLLEADDKKPPEAKDVVAGWTAFWIFIGMIVAVALLAWSFSRQIRKVNKAKASGVYGEVAAEHAEGDDSDTGEPDAADDEPGRDNHPQS